MNYWLFTFSVILLPANNAGGLIDILISPPPPSHPQPRPTRPTRQWCSQLLGCGAQWFTGFKRWDGDGSVIMRSSRGGKGG